jgi:asparagine synthase (glutamine-hydrolysing)
MMPQAFVLAAPCGWAGPGGVNQVPRLGDVFAARPSLWCDAATQVTALGRRGLVLGALFRGRRPPDSGDCVIGAVEDTAAGIAARLIRDCWGAYFAVMTDDSGGLWVLSDPSGLLPVYRTRTPGHVLLSSDPRLFAAAGVAPPSVSWADLRAHLLRPDLRRRSTCLAAIDELPRGVLVPVTDPRGEGLAVWRPGDFLARGPAPEFGGAAAALRACAVETIGAWAGMAGPVVVAASGGVDSSLVCAALAEGGHAFDCVTLATADPSCDERAYVRALADHLSVRCFAATYDSTRVDICQPASEGLPRPTRKAFMQALDAALDDGRRQARAAAVFDGNGGDNLFCFLHSAAPVLDALAAAGPRMALRAFLDMCGVTGCDVFSMARALSRRAGRRTSRDYWLPDLRLLARDAIGEPAADPLLPWLETPVGAQAGKRDHVDLIMRAQNRIHGLGGLAVPRFSPLLSQPMVELCLAIPTWLWCRGGINRALARAAFADLLPHAVRRRTSKAGPDSFVRALFAANRPTIRELLLGGLLAEQRMLDERAVALGLETDVLSGDAIVYRLLDLVEAETWARSWSR